MGLFTALNRLGTTVVVATHDVGLIEATPGAQLIRLENGTLDDPTGCAAPSAREAAVLMFEWLFASPPERRLLGAEARRAPTPWVIAIMSFSIMLIAATGLALANTASVLTRAIESRYALEVPGGGSDLNALVSALQPRPASRRSRQFPKERCERRWNVGWGPPQTAAICPSLRW